MFFNAKYVQNKMDFIPELYLLDGLTLSWRGSLSQRNQSINLQNKWMDWFLYDRDLRHIELSVKLIF